MPCCFSMSSLDKEDQIISKAKKGDLKAYNQLVLNYQDMVYTLAKRILKNTHDAQDLTQEVFIKVYHKLNQYNSDFKFAAWLYKVCYNETINKYRRIKKKNEKIEAIDNIKEDWSNQYYSLSKIENSERDQILLSALNKLDNEDRYIIWAYYYDGFNVRDISEMTGLTVSNIKIKLHRSRKKLYTLLNRPNLKENLY